MKIAQLVTDNGELILIEVRENKKTFGEEGREISASEKSDKRISGKLQELVNTLEHFTNDTVEKIKKLSPDEIELKLGFNFTISEGKLIALIAQCGGEANIEVTLKWKNESKLKS